MNKVPKVFISYRREDTRGDAGRLNDTLNQLLGLGNTFFDFEGIAPGKDSELQLKGALDQVKFLLVLVGPKWETITDSFGELRLEKHDDYVRNEVLAGLESNNLQVVPILLNRHSIPDAKDLPEVLRPLVKRQAFEIREDRWTEDVSTLLKKLEIPIDAEEDRLARQISASVEWKRKDQPDTNPRRWVVYVDNHSDGPISVRQVKILLNASEF